MKTLQLKNKSRRANKNPNKTRDPTDFIKYKKQSNSVVKLNR